MRRRRFLAFGAAAALSPSTAFAQSARALTTVRTTVNPILFGYLPLLLAIDKGYMRDAGIDVDVLPFVSSAVTQMPSIAKGDVDVAQVVAGPPFFNQYSEGFDLKILASSAESHDGWHDSDWVVVRKDLWDSGAIRKLADLRGRAVDGATRGSPINYLVNKTLIKAGLGYGDVHYTENLHTPPDTLAALQNKAVDVVASIEPETTAIVQAGAGVRFLSAQQVTPGLQNGFFIASAKYVQQNRPMMVRFLAAVLRAEREIVRAGPRLSPDCRQVLSHWAQLPPSLLANLEPPYFGQYGAIDVPSLTEQQNYWHLRAMVHDVVDVHSMIDASMLAAARANTTERSTP